MNYKELIMGYLTYHWLEVTDLNFSRIKEQEVVIGNLREEYYDAMCAIDEEGRCE